MSRNEKGILDEFVEGICTDIEMQGAIEASRDENGKIDITKATAISMGLGHTSDDDIAEMAGLLGVNGAFDEDSDDDFDNDIDYEILPTSSNNYQPISSSCRAMSENEYQNRLNSIKSSAKTGYILIGIAMLGILLSPLLMTDTDSTSTLAFVFIFGLAILGWGLFKVHQTKERDTEKLEKEYYESKHKEEEKNKADNEYIKANEEISKYKAHASSDSVSAAIKRLDEQMRLIHRIIFDDKDDSIYFDTLDWFLNSIIYETIEKCSLSPKDRAYVFDIAMSYTGNPKDIDGAYLFLDWHKDYIKTLKDNFTVTVSSVIRNAEKTGEDNFIEIFESTLCTVMVLLGEKIDTKYDHSYFGKTAVEIIKSAFEQ